MKDRARETERDGEKQREADRDRERQRQTERRDTERQGETQRDTERRRDTQRHTCTNTQTVLIAVLHPSVSEGGDGDVQRDRDAERQ